ncbi:YgjV family protein [Streptococcus orisratti]
MSIGLIFSAIGASCLAVSAFTKHKDRMLIWQVADYVFTMIANLLLGGYTGAISISVSIIRNLLMIKKWYSWATATLFVFLQLSLGAYFNNIGWVGFLPIISSISYTLATFMTNKIQWLRWVIIENMLLWSFYDWTIKAYPALIMDFFIVTTTLIAIKKSKRSKI